MKKSLFAVAFALLSASPAFAADRIVVIADTGVQQMDVSYADLNLRHPAGAHVMFGRVNFAAKRVCGGEPDFVDLPMRRYFKNCVRFAVEDALSQLQAPLVTSLYLERTPTREHYAYSDSRR
jgi:UrcA family protein